jgi:hypothetical protein
VVAGALRNCAKHGGDGHVCLTPWSSFLLDSQHTAICQSLINALQTTTSCAAPIAISPKPQADCHHHHHYLVPDSRFRGAGQSTSGKAGGLTTF